MKIKILNLITDSARLLSKSGLFLSMTLFFAKEVFASEGASAVHEAVHGNPAPSLHLVFMEVNFVILVLALLVIVKKPIKEFFAQRALVMKQNIGQSREFYEVALAESKLIQGKLEALDKESKDLIDSVKESGSDESRKIIEQSRLFAEKMHTDARKMVQAEISRANEELKDLTIKHIRGLSKEYIIKEINHGDEDRLVKKFLDRLQNSGN